MVSKHRASTVSMRTNVSVTNASSSTASRNSSLGSPLKVPASDGEHNERDRILLLEGAFEHEDEAAAEFDVEHEDKPDLAIGLEKGRGRCRG